MRKFLSFFLLLSLTLSLRAQNVNDLIIAEALAEPDSTGILDDYGRRTGWVELYNKSTGTVKYGGCYLTDDRNDLRKSLIPKTDNRTALGPRQCVIFHCSGNGADGTFYAGFTLAPGKTVYLVSNDGRTIIDSLQIPATLPAGMSVQKRAHDIRQQDFRPEATPQVPSPGSLNVAGDNSSRADILAREDPHGFTLTIVSVSVVFTALAILWFMFWLLFERPAKKKAKPAAPGKGNIPDEVAAAIALALDMEDSGDEYAAIATAVHLYLTEAVHDVEPGIVTIRRTDSQWKDKSLNFRKLPR